MDLPSSQETKKVEDIIASSALLIAKR